MKIIGAHSIIFSKNPDADRAFLRDVLHLPNIDAGDGWLIFGLPPAEVAVHPHKRNNVHKFYLLTDDIEAFIQEMARLEVNCEPVVEAEWGSLTNITLPGGGKLGVYQPRHARATDLAALI
jgi:hypothetical protein